jgi:hypothetical protein
VHRPRDCSAQIDDRGDGDTENVGRAGPLVAYHNNHFAGIPQLQGPAAVFRESAAREHLGRPK